MQYRFAVNLRTLSTLVCNDLANERVERAAVITRRIHRQLSNDITLLPLFIVEGFPGGSHSTMDRMLLSVPKFTANLYCICYKYTANIYSSRFVHICGTFGTHSIWSFQGFD